MPVKAVKDFPDLVVNMKVHGKGRSILQVGARPFFCRILPLKLQGEGFTGLCKNLERASLAERKLAAARETGRNSDIGFRRFLGVF